MRPPCSSALLVLQLLVAPAANAESGGSGGASERYFAVWSYVENAPSQEIPADQLGERDLGYWKLEFGDDGSVLGGTFHGADGAVWLSLRYVEIDGRVYADLFGPTGARITRKSTQLRDRTPR